MIMPMNQDHYDVSTSMHVLPQFQIIFWMNGKMPDCSSLTISNSRMLKSYTSQKTLRKWLEKEDLVLYTVGVWETEDKLLSRFFPKIFEDQANFEQRWNFQFPSASPFLVGCFIIMWDNHKIIKVLVGLLWCCKYLLQ